MTKLSNSILSLILFFGLGACAGSTATAEVEASKTETHEVKVIKKISESAEGGEKVLISIFTSDMDEPMVVESVGGLSEPEAQRVLAELAEKGVVIDMESGALELAHVSEGSEHEVVVMKSGEHGDMTFSEKDGHKYVFVSKGEGETKNSMTHKYVVKSAGEGKVTSIDKHVVVVNSEDMSEEELQEFLKEHDVDLDVDNANVHIHKHGELSEHGEDGHVFIFKDKIELKDEETK